MTTRITVVYILCGMYIVQIMWIYFQELKLQLYWTLLERAHSQCIMLVVISEHKEM